MPCQWIAKYLYPADKHIVARFWHRNMLKFCGFKIDKVGETATGPVLFLANHVSYLDILVLGGVINACFVSKVEVAKWPLLGKLAQLQNTIFIDRARTRGAIEKGRKAVQRAFYQKRRLIVFPEGTNTIGNVMLPFKRALLEGRTIQGYKVQPVSINVLAVNGAPLKHDKDYEVYGWGDVLFINHFWTLLGQKSIHVQVTMLPFIPVPNDVITHDTIKQAETLITQSLDLAPLTALDKQDALVAQ